MENQSISDKIAQLEGLIFEQKQCIDKLNRAVTEQRHHINGVSSRVLETELNMSELSKRMNQ